MIKHPHIYKKGKSWVFETNQKYVRTRQAFKSLDDAILAKILFFKHNGPKHEKVFFIKNSYQLNGVPTHLHKIVKKLN